MEAGERPSKPGSATFHCLLQGCSVDSVLASVFHDGVLPELLYVQAVSQINRYSKAGWKLFGVGLFTDL